VRTLTAQAAATRPKASSLNCVRCGRSLHQPSPFRASSLLRLNCVRCGRSLHKSPFSGRSQPFSVSIASGADAHCTMVKYLFMLDRLSLNCVRCGRSLHEGPLCTAIGRKFVSIASGADAHCTVELFTSDDHPGRLNCVRCGRSLHQGWFMETKTHESQLRPVRTLTAQPS